MDKVKILIDTDLGDDVDDSAALLLALNCPQFEILGITTVFKDTVKRARMVRDLLRIGGRADIPVCAGNGRALLERRFDEKEPPIQYGLLDGQPEEEENGGLRAEDFILETVRKHPDVVIVEMGCMTNLALAFVKEPKLMAQMKIIAMGGAFLNSKPEWNIICDPEAAAIVLESSENMIMMGLDVTRYLRIEENRLEQWRRRNTEAMNYYLRGVEMFREATGFPVTLHDVLLLAYLIDPAVVTLKQGDFLVELSGTMTRGTMVDQSNYYDIHASSDKNFYYAEDVDVKRFLEIVDRYF